MRQFLAIELPAEVRDAIAAAQSALRSRLSGWRWVVPENVHLTLRFLGEVGPDLDARARQQWTRVAASVRCFDLELDEIGQFPPRGRGRVLWIGARETTGPGSLDTLAGGLESAARELGFPPEHRPFRPHLTLARAARSGRPERPEIGRPPRPGRVTVDRIALVRSELRPSGARYSVLDRFPLERGAGCVDRAV